MKSINYDLSIPTSFELLNFYIEEIFNVNENNYNIKNEVLREYLRDFKEIQMIKANNFDGNFYENFLKTKDFDSKFLISLRKIVIYLSKINCYDLSLSKIKASKIAGATLFLSVKICEQILQTNYINDYLIKKIVEVSGNEINEIYILSEHILNNCKNFDLKFPNLVNLKKFYFDFLDQ